MFDSRGAHFTGKLRWRRVFPIFIFTQILGNVEDKGSYSVDPGSSIFFPSKRSFSRKIQPSKARFVCTSPSKYILFSLDSALMAVNNIRSILIELDFGIVRLVSSSSKRFN